MYVYILKLIQFINTEYFIGIKLIILCCGFLSLSEVKTLKVCVTYFWSLYLDFFSRFNSVFFFNITKLGYNIWMNSNWVTKLCPISRVQFCAVSRNGARSWYVSCSCWKACSTSNPRRQRAAMSDSRFDENDSDT